MVDGQRKRTGPYRHVLSVVLTAEQHRQFNRVALRRSRAMSSYIRELIVQELERLGVYDVEDDPALAGKVDDEGDGE